MAARVDVFQAYVDWFGTMSAFPMVTQVCLEVTELPPNELRVTQVATEIAELIPTELRITQVCVEVAAAPPPFPPVVQIPRELRLLRKIPPKPSPPPLCDAPLPESMPKPGTPAPKECFYPVYASPGDIFRIGMDWSAWLMGTEIVSVVWMSDSGLEVAPGEPGATSCWASVRVLPSLEDGEYLLRCRITTNTGAQEVRSISVYVARTKPRDTPRSWWVRL